MEKLVTDFSHGIVKEDAKIEISSGEAILFDAGRPKESLIYSTAQQLARQASKVWYVSKMCPGFQLAADLLATESFCYFNSTQQSSFPTNIAQAMDGRRAKVTNLYTGRAYIHSKFMLFEMKDGGRISLTGSHNFSWRGVKYGTQEIALVSENVSLWSRLYAYLQECNSNTVLQY
jgi:phosphatidylserine/phosphatidylglycerophosphate/cardiolipin synthase-like enzyme